MPATAVSMVIASTGGRYVVRNHSTANDREIGPGAR